MWSRYDPSRASLNVARATPLSRSKEEIVHGGAEVGNAASNAVNNARGAFRVGPVQAYLHGAHRSGGACGRARVPELCSYALGTVDARARARSGQRGDGRYAQPEGQHHEQREDKSPRGCQLRLRRPRTSVGTARGPGVAGNCVASALPQNRRWVLSECAHELDLPSNKSPSVSIPSITVIGMANALVEPDRASAQRLST